MSWLSTLGNDVKKVFGWLGSPKGQAILSTGEGIVEVVDPALDGIINLTNTWLQEIFKAQALAAAASANATGGVQKSAMVLNTVAPQIIAFATAQGLPIPTGVELQNANNALVAFLNALGGGSTATAAPVPLANTITGTAQAPLSVKTQISTNSLL
jgi:hypothetical protein